MILTRRLALTAALVLGSIAPLWAGTGIEVLEAYGRFPPGARAGAIYMTLQNQTATDDRLLSLSLDGADKAELHRSLQSADGMMTMEALPEGLPLPAGGKVTLASGGDHVMVMGLHMRPKDGDHLTLTLTFQKAAPLTIAVPVDNHR
ncbi:MAG: copper chaperone PCu(A)C, partial [Rhodobacteraceae bacterium]|nr:copper chaperone PCu(A)C [Paracoccaceae bacterium]